MALLRLQRVNLAFGGQPLLTEADLSLERNQKIALLGRNGAGKSSLLKVIAGSLPADAGERVVQQGVTISRLQQQVPQQLEGSVYTAVATGAGEAGQALAGFYSETELLSTGTGDADRISQLQAVLDGGDGWQIDTRIRELLSRMSLQPQADVSQLSGGMKRRILLARALAVNPDILLLDEPTNHLDVASIEWLESYLSGLSCTLLFITHDRAFLRSLADRIIELDRGRLSDWPGNYEAYLKGKEQSLASEEKHTATFERKLAQEEIWIRQGIKARRTRNEGRVRALMKLREQKKARLRPQGSAKMQVNAAESSGKQVIKVQDLSFAWGASCVVSNFSTIIQRGDKVGVIGPNGVGKSTLVRLLLGELKPDTGNVEHGTRLQIAYFDQLRAGLNESLSAQDNVSGGRDQVEVNGQSRHIISYMQDFLFPPDRARAPITALSGGETNRLLLAKLFLQPSNLMVLDEPTNDLDVETLELLESLIAEYQGTCIIISHDREFIDNTVTSTIAFEGSGVIREYIGGYSEWLKQHQPTQQLSASVASAKPGRKKSASKTTKLSYKDQRELDALPNLIEKMESELLSLEEQMSAADFYTRGEDTKSVIEQAAALTDKLSSAYDRWQYLEESQAKGSTADPGQAGV